MNNKRLVGKKKTLKELRKMAVDFIKLAETMRRELDKFTEQDLQKLIEKTAMTTKVLTNVDEELKQVEHLLDTGCIGKEDIPFKTHIKDFRTLVNIEFDSRFINR